MSQQAGTKQAGVKQKSDVEQPDAGKKPRLILADDVLLSSLAGAAGQSSSSDMQVGVPFQRNHQPPEAEDESPSKRIKAEQQKKQRIDSGSVFRVNYPHVDLEPDEVQQRTWRSWATRQDSLKFRGCAPWVFSLVMRALMKAVWTNR